MTGAITVFRHRHPDEPAQVGDVLDVYPVLDVVETWQPGPNVLPSLDRAAVVANPHALARVEGPIVLRDRNKLRRVKQRGCDCGRRGISTPLVCAYVREGRLWIWVRQQSFPAAVLDDVLRERASAPTAWPAHVEPTGTPHVELTTCRTCRRHWAVRITESGYEMVRLDTPTFGSVVRE